MNCRQYQLGSLAEFRRLHVNSIQEQNPRHSSEQREPIFVNPQADLALNEYQRQAPSPSQSASSPPAVAKL